MRVLIADDEEQYRTYLRASLAEHGHEVSTVDTGRSAIDYGVRFRPNVLVADWMLKNHIHGLRVAEVLRSVNPEMQTVLMTGFASEDLREEADDVGVFRFIEKPFELAEMVSTIEDAWAAKRARMITARFALLEVDSTGAIVSYNQRATQLLRSTGLRHPPQRLDEIFGDAAITYLVESNEEWTTVMAANDDTAHWMARSKTWPDGAILVLLPEGEEEHKRDSLLRLLLDTEGAQGPDWPFDDHVLVVDDAKRSRALCARLLERAGCVCYKAETQELALKLFRADTRIGVVITDYEMPGTDIDLLLSEFRTIRPAVKIVGTSKKDLRRAFATLDVERYLEKGWQISDLIAVLAD